MRNAEVKFTMDQLIYMIDGWLETIDNEEDPEKLYEEDPIHKLPEMRYPYQAGVWKARAGMNADKLRRIRNWILNEYKTIGVQSRLPKV